MTFQYDFLPTEYGNPPYGSPRDLSATELNAAVAEARVLFASARRNAKATGSREPEAVRISQFEVELSRWTRTNEIDAPRMKR